MNGILIINKEKEWTSNDVVQKVKRIFNSKVGHTGTLDPMATGVLPLLIGKGTLCSKYLINHNKKYKVLLQLGIKTDTADSEGKEIETKNVEEISIDKQNVIKVLNKFIGKQEQIPPIYSAIKVKGKKLYEYARKGQEVEIKPRNIEIYNTELLNINAKKHEIEFTVSSSKGTYIRTLCEDIAKELNTIGYMKELQRLEVEKFTLNNSIKIQELENILNDKYINKIVTNKILEEKDINKLGKAYISLENIFNNKEKINLDNNKLKLFLNGVKLTNNNKDEIYKIYNNEKFIGTGTIENKLLKRDIIIN